MPTLPWCCRKRAIVSFLSSVRRLLCARSIVYMSIGGLCLRHALRLPLHVAAQRAAHLTRMYNSCWWTPDNALHDTSAYLRSQPVYEQREGDGVSRPSWEGVQQEMQMHHVGIGRVWNTEWTTLSSQPLLLYGNVKLLVLVHLYCKRLSYWNFKKQKQNKEMQFAVIFIIQVTGFTLVQSHFKKFKCSCSNAWHTHYSGEFNPLSFTQTCLDNSINNNMKTCWLCCISVSAVLQPKSAFNKTKTANMHRRKAII